MLLLSLLTTAFAAEVLFQDVVTGGVAVDASGVSTAADGSSTLFAGDDLVVEIPSSAVVTQIFGVLQAKWTHGFAARQFGPRTAGRQTILSKFYLGNGAVDEEANQGVTPVSPLKVSTLTGLANSSCTICEPGSFN